MKLHLARVIIFTHNMAKMTTFYRDQLGLAAHVDPEYDATEWIEFDAGATRIALHKAHGKGGGKETCAHKIAFYAKNVAATRAALLKKKVKLGEVKIFGKLVMCDGVDPDGNKIQISNRK